MTKDQTPQEKISEKHAQQQRLTDIGKRVMHALGQPGDLQKVQVRHLWGDCYRVNVLVGLNFTSAKIAHSYFLVSREGGATLDSTPPVTRSY